MTGDVATAEGPGSPRSVPHRLGGAVVGFWRWFGDFRRTRPFWGGLWLMLGGWAVMKLTIAPLRVTLSAGSSGIAGYLLGGGMIVLGLLVWFSPAQKTVCGLLGTAFALAAFVASNLGGFLVGTLLGVLGGTMVFGWGQKKPRRRVRKAAVAVRGEDDTS